METPEFVVVGHVVKDLTAEGWRLGGTATFAAVQARRLGVRVGIVTRVGGDMDLAELLPEVAVAGRPSRRTTTFENIYDEGGRRQRVQARGEAIEVDDIPGPWRGARAVLLGPVLGEVPAGMGSVFDRSLVGVSAQGWLRDLDQRGRVRPSVWTGASFWSGCRALFVSEEDLGGREEEPAQWADEVPIVAVTRDRKGARVHVEGGWRAIDAFPAEEVDPTGAGDVFAAAFLVRYGETRDMKEATRFAAAAAAWSVEGYGVDGIVGRGQIELRMEEHKEITLQ